jgi:acetyltransferase-like isoleucine patch superfamily enzyme
VIPSSSDYQVDGAEPAQDAAGNELAPQVTSDTAPTTSQSKVLRVLREPGHAARVLTVVGRGWRYKIWYRMRGVRFSAGRNFRVSGRLRVRGPGRVIMGDNVHVDGLVTPWTYSADAVITIGDDSYVNGTRFGCQREITVGPRAILAHARMMDTNFHSTHIDRHSDDAPVRVAPIRLGENVWVAGSAGILPGTTIGDNSVVGFGAVCSGEFPSDSIIAGNPARVVRPVPGSLADPRPRDRS